MFKNEIDDDFPDLGMKRTVTPELQALHDKISSQLGQMQRLEDAVVDEFAKLIVKQVENPLDYELVIHRKFSSTVYSFRLKEPPNGH